MSRKKSITKIQTTEFYSFEPILKYGCTYSWALGERTNGKTFDGKFQCHKAVKEGGQFIYLRRRHSQITRAKMYRLFENIEDEIEKGNVERQLPDYIKYSTDKGFFIVDEEGYIRTVGYPLAIEDMYNNKGDDFNGVTLIFFDEVIEDNYLEDEIKYFIHTISTIVRERPNVKIIMTANTINRACPYFDLFGIDFDKLRRGYIHTVFHKKGSSIAIELCKNKVEYLGEVKKSKYVGFDDCLTTNMILNGEWEYNATNTKAVDGIGWSCKDRRKLYAYFTYLNVVYEASIYVDDNPIAFIRDINTQNGLVKPNIKYNFAFDDTVQLSSTKGIVPRYTKIVDFIDEETRYRLDIINKCIDSSRVVFNTVKTGTEFLNGYKKFI